MYLSMQTKFEFEAGAENRRTNTKPSEQHTKRISSGIRFVYNLYNYQGIVRT